MTSWTIGALAAVLYVAARDAARMSAKAGFALLGALSIALLAIAAIESLIARAQPRWPSQIAWRRAPIAVVTIAPAALGLVRWWAARGSLPAYAPLVIVAVAAASAIALDRAASRIDADRGGDPGPGRALAAVILAAIFMAVHASIGTLEAVREGTGARHVGLFAGLQIASCAVFLPLGARPSLHREGAPARLPPVAAAATLALGVALLEVDRRALVGLYVPLHLWLGATGVLCIASAIGSLSAGKSGKTWRIAGAVSAVSLVAPAVALVQGHLAAPAVRAEIAGTPSGRWVLEVLANRARKRRTVPPPEHPALRFDQHLDERPQARDLNLLLITVDALRADRIGAVGSPSPNTPRLARLAGESVRFRRAYAQGTRTAVAMGALMIGRYSANIDWQLWPYAGGRLHDPGKGGKDARKRLGGRFVYSTLPEIPPEGTLAERLQRAGFFTTATPFAGQNEFFRRGFGFDRGFESFQDLSRTGWKPPTSDRVAEAAVDELAKAAGKRWFSWVHFYDPHESKDRPAAYDRLIAAFDRALGTLLDALAARGLDGRTVVVVMADHGESFGEHGAESHGTNLYDEQARIPLLVRMPGVAPRDEARVVAAIDVTATLLALGGASTRGLDGVNLLPLLLRGEYPANRPVFTEIHRYQSNQALRTVDMKAVVLGDLKLVEDRRTGAAELFDLAADPAESRNLIGAKPEDFARLDAILESFVERAEAEHPLP